EPPEQRDQLDLLVPERIRLAPDERDHADRPRAYEQWRDEPAPEPEREKLRLRRIAQVLHVLAVDRLPFEHRVEYRAGRSTRGPRSKDRLRAEACGRDHAGLPLLDEHDREALEVDQAAHLADERAE